MLLLLLNDFLVVRFLSFSKGDFLATRSTVRDEFGLDKRGFDDHVPGLVSVEQYPPSGLTLPGSARRRIEPIPVSRLVVYANDREGGDWLDQLMGYLRDTQTAVTELLTAELPQIRVTTAEGTYLLWLDCRGLGLSDVDLHRFFIDDAELGLSAGTVFGPGGSGFMRLNIGAPRAEILTAIRKLVTAWKLR